MVDLRDLAEEFREIADIKRTRVADVTPEQWAVLSGFTVEIGADTLDALADWLDEREEQTSIHSRPEGERR